MERLKIKVAVYLLLIREDKILLLRRRNTGWQDGNYGLPAGHLELNETIIEGLLREVKEEIGLVLKPEDVRLVHVMHRMSNYVDFFFVSQYQDKEPKNEEPESCDDLDWFSIKNLPDNMVPSVRSAINNYIQGVTFFEFTDKE